MIVLARGIVLALFALLVLRLLLLRRHALGARLFALDGCACCCWLARRWPSGRGPVLGKAGTLAHATAQPSTTARTNAFLPQKHALAAAWMWVSAIFMVFLFRDAV